MACFTGTFSLRNVLSFQLIGLELTWKLNDTIWPGWCGFCFSKQVKQQPNLACASHWRKIPTRQPIHSSKSCSSQACAKLFLLLPVLLMGVPNCLSLAEPGPLPAYMNNMKLTSYTTLKGFQINLMVGIHFKCEHFSKLYCCCVCDDVYGFSASKCVLLTCCKACWFLGTWTKSQHKFCV